VKHRCSPELRSYRKVMWLC